MYSFAPMLSKSYATEVSENFFVWDRAWHQTMLSLFTAASITTVHWTSWTPCSVTCGFGGTRQRTKTCYDTSHHIDMSLCTHPIIEQEPCTPQHECQQGLFVCFIWVLRRFQHYFKKQYLLSWSLGKQSNTRSWNKPCPGELHENHRVSNEDQLPDANHLTTVDS